ncbi:MAG: DUF2970 domain-containing protein [Porticoccaceae bacterium]
MKSMSEKDRKQGFKSLVFSVLAGALGVQSNKNRERDFKQGKISTYIIAGLVFTALFITVVVGVVKLVLHNAGI